MRELEKREEEMKMIAKKIQDSGLRFPDIREREWSKINIDTAKLLNLLIEAEDILVNLDEYQMNNGQCYPDVEDMLLEIGYLRAKYTDFVEKNIEVLNINLK